MTGDAHRVGDTVRRTARPWSASVQAVLRHLQRAGISGVPQPLGFEPPADARWMLAMPGDLPAEVVRHNDFAPYNVVFALTGRRAPTIAAWRQRPTHSSRSGSRRSSCSSTSSSSSR